ncbi:MAG: restriction endonuclease subunit S [Acidobacteria bacterium]|nr:restriction endonuclease subunit S [Acidobacteriota bacterium]
MNDRIDNPLDAGVERYVGLEHLDSDSLAIRRWAPPTAVTATKLLFRRGDIIFGRRRVYQRKLAVADFDGICSAHALVLRAKSGVVLPEFLPFFMQSDLFMERAEAISVGSLSPTINWRTLASEQFALPPLDEQHRIAATLRECDRATQALHGLGKAMRVAQASLFDTLLADSITRSVLLGSLLTDAPRNGCSAVEASTPTGHWVLGLDALSKSGYRPGRLKPVQRTTAMLSSVVEAGDLLISRSNTRDRVGLPGIFNEARCDVSWPDTMMRLRPDPSVVRPHFLELLLRSQSGRRQIERFAAGTSASMKKINADAIRQLPIVLPSSDTQDAMLRQVGGMMAACASAERRLRTLKRLRSTVLSSAL